MHDYIKRPMDIEKRSFEIIEEELGSHNFNNEELLIVKRVIHTTADFEYKNLLYISDLVIQTAKELFKKGVTIYTDTKMAQAGINKQALNKLNCTIKSYIADKDVADTAKERGMTRSMAAVEKAVQEGIEFFVFGNAPTALFRLKELIEEGKSNPKLIIACPIGFVGAKESKESIEKLDIPMITVRGRKGGSTVAASIINALLYMAVDRK